MAVHAYFVGGMGDNIYTKLETDGSIDRVAKVLSQIIGTLRSCKFNKLVNVKYNTCRVGNRLGKDSFGVGWNAFSSSSAGASWSTRVVSMPNRFKVTASRLEVPP